MRQFAVLLSTLALLVPSAESVLGETTVSATPRVVSSGPVCPNCGRVHGSTPTVTVSSPSRPVSSPSQSVGATYPSAVTTAPRPTTVSVSSGGSASNVLAVLNNQRSRQGLRSLRYDSVLQAVAERRARKMASMGMKGHPPGSFSPGRYEGVGWSSSYTPNGVHACYTSDPRMTAAGAAMVTGRDGVYFAVVYR